MGVLQQHTEAYQTSCNLASSVFIAMNGVCIDKLSHSIYTEASGTAASPIMMHAGCTEVNAYIMLPERSAEITLGTDAFYITMKQNKLSLLSPLSCILRGPDPRA